jgi:hypothetical protein
MRFLVWRTWISSWLRHVGFIADGHELVGS